ncbi:hypothetical protein [Marinoscillum sp. MHG1-6]|uniref:hypothetical protein n=1 Tax=Marinoscillum sp. MHG1-6 TaxID=2959627 RepID=UPI0021580A59|nr:hypothetical protein [Marinoscillum sp. MHG1-6]
MKLELTRPTLEKAEMHFQEAMKEFSRPKEDVVPFMVCESAYNAVLNYFKAFIEDKEGIVDDSDSPAVLLAECRLLDPRFNELNVDLFDLKDKNDDVLMDMKTMHRYMSIMNTARSLVGGH